MNNNYNEDRCQGVLRDLWSCCAQFYERQGADARCSACPKPDLLKLKLKQYGLEGGKGK